MESFFSSMKKEELYRTNYRGVDHLKKRIQWYIDLYNNERPHAALRYMTPNAYEDAFFALQSQATTTSSGGLITALKGPITCTPKG